MSIWAALRTVLTPLNLGMAVLFAAGLTFMAMAILQYVWGPEPPQQNHDPEA